MSRIDWAKAEVKYVTKPEASYNWMARLFGVEKSTVVRHASRRRWTESESDTQSVALMSLKGGQWRLVLKPTSDIFERYASPKHFFIMKSYDS